MPAITSRQHPVVKTFRSVARGSDTTALVDGWHLLGDAHRARIDVETVAIAGDPPDGETAYLVGELERTARVVNVSPEVMHAISPVRTPTGVAAIVRKREASLEQTLTPRPALVVVAVDLQDPGNAGALVRAAEAGGATGVIFCGASADPWGWKALRAAMGSTFRLPVVRAADAASTIERLRTAGVRVAAASPRNGTAMDDADLTGDVALLLGGEGEGLPPSLSGAADVTVSIPMGGAVESLNVAVAAAVLVYEASRQRRTSAGRGPAPRPSR